MKKQSIISMVFMIIGVVLIAVGMIVPVVAVERAEEQGTIAIIGGADAPTHIYVRSVMMGGVMPVLIALGVLAVISGIIVLIIDRTAAKKQ